MDPQRTKIDISSGTIIRAILIVLAFAFLFFIRNILFLLLAAIVIASAIDPIARRLRIYKIPRALSVVVVYIAVLAVLGGALSLVIPPLAEQSAQLAKTLPEVLGSFSQRLGITSIGQAESALPQIQEGLSRFGERLTDVSINLFQQTRNVFSGIVSILFVFIIAFYLVIEEDALKKLFRLIMPKEHIARTERTIDLVHEKLGRWVIGQLTLGLIVGIIVGVGLWLLGVPYALALGILAGVMEIIPVIGPIIAGIFGVLIALSQSLLLGVVALVFYVAVQQVENHLLVPNIMRRATGLNPLITLIAVLLGARVAGVVGVILSVPIATIISILLADLLANQPEDELAG